MNKQNSISLIERLSNWFNRLRSKNGIKALPEGETMKDLKRTSKEKFIGSIQEGVKSNGIEERAIDNLGQSRDTNSINPQIQDRE